MNDDLPFTGARSLGNPKSEIQNPKSPSSFAVVFLPDFALQAAVRLEETAAKLPCVLLEEVGRKAVAAQVDALARAAGVVPGMTAPQVLARCPEALLRTRSPQGEELAQEALVAAAFALSPRVEETAEGVCTVDLTGVPRKGLPERARSLVGELGKIGLAAKIGFGSNPLRAFFAAQRAEPVLAVENEREFLAALPLAAADPSPQLREILQQWGVRTLGALAALPRQEIANRLGEEGIALWDRAAGRGERVLRLTVLPEEFEEKIELEQEVETLEPLLFLLRRFIGQLTLRLAAAHRAAEEVRLTLFLKEEGGRQKEEGVYKRTFRLPEPSCDPELLFRMLHTHLENVRTEHPVVEVRLWMKPCQPVAKQTDLFEAAVKDAHGFAETLARLVAIVGSGNVGSPRLEPTHRPDAFRLEPLEDVGGRENRSARESNGGFEKPPMRRFRPPIPAQVWLEDGRPVHLKSGVANGRILSARGPWRLSGNWWDQLYWARDEWDIELADGARYRLVRERKAWFVEGEVEGILDFGF